MEIKIKKFNNGNLNLKLEGENQDGINLLELSELLFFSDLYITTSPYDGTLTLLDFNKSLVYTTGYYRDIIKELKAGALVKMYPSKDENIDDYIGD